MDQEGSACTRCGLSGNGMLLFIGPKLLMMMISWAPPAILDGCQDGHRNKKTKMHIYCNTSLLPCVKFTFMSRKSIFKTTNIISDIKSVTLCLNIQYGFEVQFLHISFNLQKKVSMIFFIAQYTHIRYMFESFLILEIYLTSTLF